MKKFFLLLGLIMLAACTTSYDREVDRKAENLQAVLFNKNKLYLVGELTDYQFAGDDVLALQQFLQSPLAKQAKANITRLRIYNKKEVRGSYEIVFNLQSLSETQIKQLQKDYGFKISEEFLTREYSAEGKPVKLANRQELLNKYAFAQPIHTEVQFNQTYTTIDKEATQLTGMMIIAAPVIIVGAVIIAPFALFCTAINGCN